MGVKMYIDFLDAEYARWGKHLFDSILEVPNGGNPDQNAWLTIRFCAQLQFADANNSFGRVYRDGSRYFVRDSDKQEYRIENWDASSIEAFRRGFLAGESVWNYRFTLLPPPEVVELDYVSGGMTIRPNILCLFRVLLAEQARQLKPPCLPHQGITVVRLDPTGWERFRDWGFNNDFRSNWHLLHSGDVDARLPTYTQGHELGHNMNQDHILGLMGDPRCKMGTSTADAPRCYEGRNKSEDRNIMGNGKEVQLVNAISWLERVKQHTGTEDPKYKWRVTQDMTTRPRRIGLAQCRVGDWST